MYNDIFIMIINTVINFLEVLDFPIVIFNGISITYLHLVLACFIIPILLSFIKLSVSETNSLNDIGFLSNGSRTNRVMAYSNSSFNRNSPLYRNQSGQYRNPKNAPSSVDTDGWL